LVRLESALSADGTFHQIRWIQQMLRTVMLGGPAAALCQLDTQKITHAFKTAVTNGTHKFAVAKADREWSSGQNGRFDLKADARERNVFQVGYAPVMAAFAVNPSQFDQFRTQQTIWPAAI
jgi:hypothetical protein